MSEEIIKVLSYIGSQFGIAIDWTSQNILPYLEQLGEKIVNLDIATNYMFLVLAGLLFIVGTVVAIIFFHKLHIDDIGYDDEIGYYVVGIILIIIALTGFILIWCDIYNLLVAYNTPEITIWNYCKSLLPTTTR